MSGLGLFKREGNCPACAEQRTHTDEEWQYHPLSKHGFNGARYTHPDAEAASKADRERLQAAKKVP